MSSIPNRESATHRAKAFVNDISTHHSLPRPGAANPSDTVSAILKDSIASPENLAAGQVLTQYLQLPAFYFSVFAPAIKGEPPYKRSYGLKITVKNDCPRKLSVLYDRTYHKTFVRDRIGWVEGDTGYWEDHVKQLAPGDEIELDPEYAILALQEHSRSGNPPQYWNVSGAIPERDDLVEVAYRCNVLGEDGEPINSRKFKPADEESVRKGRRRMSE